LWLYSSLSIIAIAKLAASNDDRDWEEADANEIPELRIKEEFDRIASRLVEDVLHAAISGIQVDAQRHVNLIAVAAEEV
jgi:hypothetical protein